MYPTISFFLEQELGIKVALPIQTYGFFVALAYLTATLVLHRELSRKVRGGRFTLPTRQVIIGKPATTSGIASNALLGFILGFKFVEAIFHYSDFVNNPQDFILSGRGNWPGAIALAVLFGYMHYRERKRKQLDKPKAETQPLTTREVSGTILLLAAVFGLLGAKIFHNLENFDALMANPIKEIFSFGGFTFYGGLVVGLTAVMIYANKMNIKPLHLLDTGAPALAVAYAVGRLGCHFSGDGCWGIPNPHPKPEWLSWLPDRMWANEYAHNVINEGHVMDMCSGKFCHVLNAPVFPTSLYESLMMFAIFAILWALRKRISIPGMLFAIYLVFGGIERFFIEKVRVNNVYHIFGAEITQAEIISFVSFALGVTGIVWLYMKRKKLVNY